MQPIVRMDNVESFLFAAAFDASVENDPACPSLLQDEHLSQGPTSRILAELEAMVGRELTSGEMCAALNSLDLADLYDSDASFLPEDLSDSGWVTRFAERSGAAFEAKLDRLIEQQKARLQGQLAAALEAEDQPPISGSSSCDDLSAAIGRVRDTRIRVALRRRLHQLRKLIRIRLAGRGCNSTFAIASSQPAHVQTAGGKTSRYVPLD